MTALGGRSITVEPHMADLTENSRIFAAAAPLGQMEPWQIVNFLRAIEDDAARRALLAAAAELRRSGSAGLVAGADPHRAFFGGQGPDDVLALLERWAERPDRLVR